jgi:hypothetical protein
MTLYGICKKDTGEQTDMSSTWHLLPSLIIMPLFRKTLTFKDTVYGQLPFRKYCQNIVRILTVLFWTPDPLSLFSCFGTQNIRNVFALSFISLVRIKLSNQKIILTHPPRDKSLYLSARTERDFYGQSTGERIVLTILSRRWLSSMPFHLRCCKAVVEWMMEGLPCSSNWVSIWLHDVGVNTSDIVSEPAEAHLYLLKRPCGRIFYYLRKPLDCCFCWSANR